MSSQNITAHKPNAYDISQYRVRQRPINEKVFVAFGAGFFIVCWTLFAVLYLAYAKDVSNYFNRLLRKLRKTLNIDQLTFTQKKYAYLFCLLIANIVLAALVFNFAGFKLISFILIFLKCKDVVTSIAQTIYFITQFIKRSVLRIREKPLVIKKSNIISLVPVYSETKEQIDGTVFSVLDNEIGEHTNLIVIFCDGLEVNIEDSLTEVIETTKEQYVSWKLQENTLSITYGRIKDAPCMVVKKQKNQGKRDTLIVGHDIFNVPRTNIHEKCLVLRERVRAKIRQHYGLDEFQFMFCTDADSILTTNTFTSLIETMERRGSVACCGLVVVDCSEGPWDLWMVFQNFQYLYGQYIRRGTENMLNKVTCLPGCVTMFRIHEYAAKAIAMYSELPDKDDMLKTTVQLLGTDRRLTCSFLWQSKDVVINYDTRAKCWTIPPDKLYSYISQRRRWGSNSYFNTYCNIWAPNVHPITRLFALLDYFRLSLVYFRMFNTILFIYQMTHKIGIMQLIPFLLIVTYPTLFFFAYSLFDPFLRKQFLKLLLGYLYNKALAPFISMMVLSNMYWNIGSTKWGGNQKDMPAETAETVPTAENADAVPTALAHTTPAPVPAELFIPAEQAVKEVVIEINDPQHEEKLELSLPMPPAPKGEEQV
jgi:cellulose synthase/poly-beta-1,6-N-acetylglucosamine synthase-like glycosyltransferase